MMADKEKDRKEKRIEREKVEAEMLKQPIDKREEYMKSVTPNLPEDIEEEEKKVSDSNSEGGSGQKTPNKDKSESKNEGNEEKKDAKDKEKEKDKKEFKPVLKDKKDKAKKAKKGKREVDCEYNLYLQDDTNADSALFQWYYFSCMNIKAGTTARINICNLSKPNGLYSKGMKPFIYSCNKKRDQGVGWHRAGDHVKYFQNGSTARFTKQTLDAHWVGDGSVPKDGDKFKALHSLSWEYKFESDFDIVFFAHFVPYTYTD